MRRPVSLLLRPGFLVLLAIPTLAHAQEVVLTSDFGTFTSFDIPGADYTQVRDINRRGDIVGFFFDRAPTGIPLHGFLRDKDGGFTTLDYPGAVGTTIASGINAQGDIVGSFVSFGHSHGFLRTHAGVFTSFDYPKALGTSAWAINASGNIVGQYEAGRTCRAFLRHTDGTFTSIEVPHAVFTQAFDINSSGDIVGQYRLRGVTHGFLRTAGGNMVSFDVPISINSWFGTQARAITDSGEIIGWCITTVGKRRGFRLGKHGFTYFDLPGAAAIDADGVNAQGDIVGGYIDAAHHHHSYILKSQDPPQIRTAETSPPTPPTPRPTQQTLTPAESSLRGIGMLR